MKLNLLKGFAAVAMLCIIGAVFATPVALGDIGYYLSEKYGISGAAAGGGFGYFLGDVGKKLERPLCLEL